MANWSDLSLDLLVSVANRMDLVEDFIAFGLVCKSWRLASAWENFTGGLTHQVPWLLIHPTDKNNIEGNSVAEIYNMIKGNTHKLSLAESTTHKVHSSSLGWLITVSDDFDISLLHPLNHHPVVKLPNFLTYKSCENHPSPDTILNKFALSSSPSSTSDYIVMAIYDHRQRLAFCRPGDDEWTIVAGSVNRGYHDVTYYKGQFSIVDSRGCVLVCDIKDSGEAKTRVIIDRSVPLRNPNCDVSYNLVESRGVLLAVQQFSFVRPINDFRVFEVPFSNGNWSDSEVTDLGSRTLFLDEKCLFSVEASTYSSCEKNCVYFISQSGCGTDRRGIFIFSQVPGYFKIRMGEFPCPQIPQLWIQPSL